MITKKQLLQTLSAIAPEEKAEAWDNGGIQIFAGNDSVHTVLTALDVTEAVIDEAIEKHADWIITHHPLFFSEIKSLDEDDLTGRLSMRLIRHKISLYAAHTSFDSASGGNNDYLASLLNIGLEKEAADGIAPPFLYISKPLRQAISFEMLCESLQSALNIKRGLSYTCIPAKPIHKIAICTGSGADCIKPAMIAGCDLLITGDLKYHAVMTAGQMGFCVIDAGHFDTEKMFSTNMADKLQSFLGQQVQVIVSDAVKDPYLLFSSDFYSGLPEKKS